MFSHYAESGAKGILVLAFYRLFVLSVANVAAIATFKQNPAFHVDT